MVTDAIHLVLQDLIEAAEPIPPDAPARPAHEPIRELLTVAVQRV
jgi:predicted RNase H-like HicB family nuclease